ncbi:GH1 family beta-glucosidase [Streptomyces sp. NPDC020681]|uniref:GH1 family beta-glucosidase n=1 Tax=Streptomyces sp. NPDC020681 TaxID=3365083 RepID=UPI00379985B1
MTPERSLVFPERFRWGAATSAFQIEGAPKEDGRGPSIWDNFVPSAENSVSGDDGTRACDHYHRFRDDVALMSELGLPAYRFSVAWPRVQPDGRTFEPRGMSFYDRLVDELLECEIEPVVTLYHWDLPQALEDAGGWTNRVTAQRFADYAQLVYSVLSDRVADWTTFNEPLVAAFLGYGSAVHAPGRANSADALQAGHHMLVGHGLAVKAMRAQETAHRKFSVALNFSPVLLEVNDEEHREAARKFDGLHNRWFLDAVTGRGYPADVLDDLAHLRALEPVLRDGDFALMSAPIDWLGVNYYAPSRLAPMAADPSELGSNPLPGLRGSGLLPARGPLTSFAWERTPASLTDLLVWLHQRHPGLPLEVTENGAAFRNVVGDGGGVHDKQRVNCLADHQRAIHTAIMQGADVRGYFARSLLDNFEWAMGYSQRFGIVHVDFDTMRRSVKDSGRYFAQVIADNAVPAGLLVPNGPPVGEGDLTRIS